MGYTGFAVRDILLETGPWSNYDYANIVDEALSLMAISKQHHALSKVFAIHLSRKRGTNCTPLNAQMLIFCPLQWSQAASQMTNWLTS